MKLGTVIVGLLLAFLLFTSQGRSIVEITAEMALYAATPQPAPDPVKVAAEKASGACRSA